MNTTNPKVLKNTPQSSIHPEERVIGIFDENHRGPLVIMFGGIHGNETAGVKALEYLIKMLEVEHITNETFQLC